MLERDLHTNLDPVTGSFNHEEINPEMFGYNLQTLRRLNPYLSTTIILTLIAASACDTYEGPPQTDIASENQPKVTEVNEAQTAKPTLTAVAPDFFAGSAIDGNFDIARIDSNAIDPFTQMKLRSAETRIGESGLVPIVLSLTDSDGDGELRIIAMGAKRAYFYADKSEIDGEERLVPPGKGDEGLDAELVPLIEDGVNERITIIGMGVESENPETGEKIWDINSEVFRLETDGDGKVVKIIYIDQFSKQIKEIDIGADTELKSTPSAEPTPAPSVLVDELIVLLTQAEKAQAAEPTSTPTAGAQELSDETLQLVGELGENFSLERIEGKNILVRDGEYEVGEFDDQGNLLIQLPRSGEKELDLKKLELEAFEGDREDARWLIIDEKNEKEEVFRYMNREGSEWEKWYMGKDRIVSDAGIKYSIGENEIGVHIVNTELLDLLWFYAISQTDMDKLPPNQVTPEMIKAWFDENPVVEDFWRVKRHPEHDPQKGFIRAVAQKTEKPLTTTTTEINLKKYTEPMKRILLGPANHEIAYGLFSTNIEDSSNAEQYLKVGIILPKNSGEFAKQYNDEIFDERTVFQNSSHTDILSEQTIIMALIGQLAAGIRMEEQGRDNSWYFLEEDGSIIALSRWGTTLHNIFIKHNLFAYTYNNYPRIFEPVKIE